MWHWSLCECVCLCVCIYVCVFDCVLNVPPVNNERACSCLARCKLFRLAGTHTNTPLWHNACAPQCYLSTFPPSSLLPPRPFLCLNSYWAPRLESTRSSFSREVNISVCWLETLTKSPVPPPGGLAGLGGGGVETLCSNSVKRMHDAFTVLCISGMSLCFSLILTIDLSLASR